MKQSNPEDEGKFEQHSRGIGTVTEEMIAARAREIALINGRSPKHVQESDHAQARRELLGEETLAANETPAEQVPEGERWQPVEESLGRRAETFSPHDEQTDNEKLVEEGMSEAEHDLMVKATKEGLRRDVGH